MSYTDWGGYLAFNSTNSHTFWFKSNGDLSLFFVMGNVSTNFDYNTGWEIYCNGGALWIGGFDASYMSFDNPGNACDGNWHHVAVGWDGGSSL